MPPKRSRSKPTADIRIDGAELFADAMRTMSDRIAAAMSGVGQAAVRSATAMTRAMGSAVELNRAIAERAERLEAPTASSFANAISAALRREMAAEGSLQVGDRFTVGEEATVVGDVYVGGFVGYQEMARVSWPRPFVPGDDDEDEDEPLYCDVCGERSIQIVCASCVQIARDAKALEQLETVTPLRTQKPGQRRIKIEG